jgi:hypothetical protein
LPQNLIFLLTYLSVCFQIADLKKIPCAKSWKTKGKVSNALTPEKELF